MRPFLKSLLNRRSVQDKTDKLSRAIKFETVCRNELVKNLKEAHEELTASFEKATRTFNQLSISFDEYNKLKIATESKIEEYREKERVMQETIKALLLSNEVNNKCREAEISHQVRIISAQGARNQ